MKKLVIPFFLLIIVISCNKTLSDKEIAAYKEKGSFIHPKGFTQLVDMKLERLGDKIPVNNCISQPPKGKRIQGVNPKK